MKRKILTSLLLVTVLMLAVPAGIVAAKAQPQDIAFDMTGSWDEEGYDPETGDPIGANYDAAVVLTGKISGKGSGTYLSPLHGTIAVGDSEYSIQVKQIKQSEPLYGDEMVIYYPNSQQPRMVMVTTQGIVEANVEGKKFIGWLDWNSTTMYFPDGTIMFESGGTDLTLSGIVDGKRVSVSLAGGVPSIE
jgi:hypothetical protein